MTKHGLCHCGSCRQAFDRALEIVRKMELDRECPVFGMGVAIAMKSIVASMVAAAEANDAAGNAEAISLHKKVNGMMMAWAVDDVTYLHGRIDEVCDLHNKLVEETDKLPKGA